MMMIMRIAPHLWDFVVLKNLITATSTHFFVPRQVERQVQPSNKSTRSFICLSFIYFWEENVPYMIYMATNLKHTRRFSLQVPLQVEERAPVPEPDSKIQSSFQNSDLRNSESRVRSSSELGTQSSESSTQQTYSSVQVIWAFDETTEDESCFLHTYLGSPNCCRPSSGP